MRICPKCKQEFYDGSQICRECGAILEDVEVSPTEPEAPLAGADHSAGAERPAANSETDAMPIADVGHGEPIEDGPTWARWQCSKCQETMEPNFHICWSCGTARDGTEDPHFVVDRDVADETAASSPWPQEIRDETAEQCEPCAKCGSTQVIPNACLGDQGQGSDGVLKAQVIGRPEAWVFRNVRQSELRASICGSCGHVELHVTNPGLLYRHYLDLTSQE